MDTLYIIIPAYNEEANVETVAKEWHHIVEKTGADSKLLIIDDGSKDGTYKKLTELQFELPQLQVITKKNSGHGATILYGYNTAIASGADYVFQTDSDGQTLPDEFWPFWDKRTEYDAQIGYRKKRQDGISRIFITKILRLVLRLSFDVWITDANSPFRLIKATCLKTLLLRIPKDYNLSNVILTVLLEKTKARMRYMQITFRPRQGGVNSLNIKHIFKIGRKALHDFKVMRKEMEQK
jgi:glycosyltransferase involved in cell wall biosynthesis